MGIPERKERQKNEMKRAILKGALKLFLKAGFENVTMRKIAETMEYSPATIYLYFKNKDSILFALHEDGFERLYERQQKTLSILDPRQRLLEHGRVYIAFAKEMPDLYDLMFITRAPIKEIQAGGEWNAGKRAYDFLRSNVKDCIDKGYFPGAGVETIALFMWALVHGIASLIIRDRMGVLPREELDRMIEEGLTYFILKREGK
jgi:AcrR family transcriptional regulator